MVFNAWRITVFGEQYLIAPGQGERPAAAFFLPSWQAYAKIQPSVCHCVDGYVARRNIQLRGEGDIRHHSANNGPVFHYGLRQILETPGSPDKTVKFAGRDAKAGTPQPVFKRRRP
ncbi:hypothetical protein D3C81_2004680 [compost metagenome]